MILPPLWELERTARKLGIALPSGADAETVSRILVASRSSLPPSGSAIEIHAGTGKPVAPPPPPAQGSTPPLPPATPTI